MTSHEVENLGGMLAKLLGRACISGDSLQRISLRDINNSGD
jgi:hypothetical protein